MKRLLLVVGMLGFASPALAAGPVYAGVHLDLAIFHDVSASQGGGSATVSYKTGFGIGGEVGYRANENFRVEGEIGYRSADVETFGGETVSGVSLSTTSFIVNGYYDFAQVKAPVVPYVGLGVGFISGTVKGFGQSYSDTEFGYQLTLGIAYAVNQNVSLNAAYRYQGSSAFSSEGTTLPYKASNIIFGLNYLF